MATGVLATADRAVLAAVQTPHASWLDLLASIVSLGGDATVTAGIALGIVVARLRARRSDAWLPLAIAITVLVEAACKIVVPEVPPPHESARTIVILPTLQASFPYAFPSGHVARFTFFVTANGVGRVPTLVGVVVMALTRVYLAEHWLSDAIGGALLGVAVAWAARSLHSRAR